MYVNRLYDNSECVSKNRPILLSISVLLKHPTAMLEYAFSVSKKEKGRAKVILGCYKEKLASAATIQKNGGTLITENENYKEVRTASII